MSKNFVFKKFDKCPYCKSEMRLQILSSENSNYYSSRRNNGTIAFVCDVCKASSPELYIQTFMIDKEKVAEEMKTVIEEIERENEEYENEDDEEGEDNE